ncbi:MAG: glycosyltransferase family 87 protein [Chthoniobacteraceae bacterium]
MTLYPLGAEALLHGESLERGAPGFTYPPVVALVMIPLVPLPMWLKNLTWYLMLVASTYWSFRLCERLVIHEFPELTEEKKAIRWRILGLLLSLKFILAVLENQAYDSLVLLAVLVGLRGMQMRKDIQAALGIALAAAMKVTPLLFLPYLLWKRRVKLFVLTAVFFTGISFFPDAVFVQKGATSGYFVTWVVDIAGGTIPTKVSETQPRHWDLVNPLNQSLRGFVYQLTAGPEAHAYRKPIFYSTCITYILIIFVLIVLSVRMPRALLTDSCLLLISMLMLSPMSSKSHFVSLMLPYIAASAYVITEPRMRKVGGGLLIVSFVLESLTSKDLIGKRLADFCSSIGCVTIGTLVMVVFFGYVILKHRTDRPAQA